MIKEKCVLILGAGASAPYGFPTGAKLKEIICSTFSKKWENFVSQRSDYLDTITVQLQKQLADDFVNDFNKFDHDSIDLFLDIYKDFSDIGKKAIFLSILDAEKSFHQVGNVQDWYSELFRKMIGPAENYFKLSENNLTIVTFNYDRSLEYYLYNIFKNFPKAISDKTKIEELIKINIFHVYGKLSDLPWENENDSLDYGVKIWMKHLETKKNNIKTIFDRRENIKELDSIKYSINMADKIYFLGFGFAKENAEILSLGEVIKPNQRTYVTDYDKRHVRTENQMKGLGIWRENYTEIIQGADCKRVIEDYLF